MPGPQPNIQPRPVLGRKDAQLVAPEVTPAKKKHIGIVNIDGAIFMFDRKELVAFAITEPRMVMNEDNEPVRDTLRGQFGQFHFRNGLVYEFTHLRNKADLIDLEAQVGAQWDPDSL